MSVPPHQADGLPPALPSAPSNPAPFPPVDAPDGRNTGGKVEHPVSHFRVPAVAPARTPGTRRRPGRGPGRPSLRAILGRLSDRDRLVLTLIADHKFLTSRQLQALAFTHHASELSAARTCRRVLRRLHRDRLIAPLPRRVGGMYGGADDSVWHLVPTGYRLWHLAAGGNADGTPLRIRQPSIRAVDHCLAVADVRITVEQTAGISGDITVTAVRTEPSCWRRYTGSLGVTEILKPDMELVTRTWDGEYEDHWFIEVDLDTEHPPTVVRQCQRYETYRRTGQEQERAGVFPLVAWVVPSETRADRLRRAIRAAHRLDAHLFRVITGDQIAGLISLGEGGEV